MMKKIIAATALCVGFTQAADPEQTTVREVRNHLLEKAQSQVLEPSVEYLTGGQFEKDTNKATNQAIALEKKVETYVKEQATNDRHRVEKKVKKEKNKVLKKVSLGKKKNKK